ncbi:hypothetical protein HO173_013105 [Letharia columbiana]|uniref:Uncharacterized protein n=1 Tax=Letharia columbiana TaxID=112416 RepID=A0A8H6CHU3_9LECA|nr:uncharacterized protein HO173_013105 [Letharia columbiana]KAF6223860.1 hypothetical protein HO173_013105 [Letharia columbiana]
MQIAQKGPQALEKFPYLSDMPWSENEAYIGVGGRENNDMALKENNSNEEPTTGAVAIQISHCCAEGGDARGDSQLAHLVQQAFVGSNSSTTSPSGGSHTSTIKCDREPYDVFSECVGRLCQKLWPPEKSIKLRILKSKAAARLRTNSFCGSLVPSLQIPLIERLPGGDYNRITGIILPSSYSVDSRRLILRVPREKTSRPDREVATLNYVRERTSIPVAQVAAKDFSRDNSLKKPYELQHRIPGTDINLVWNDLSYSQPYSVARKLGGVNQIAFVVREFITAYVVTEKESEKLLIVPFELGGRDGYGELLEGPDAKKLVRIQALP